MSRLKPVFVLGVAIAFSAPWQARSEERRRSRIDPKAQEQLEKMSESMRSMNAFQFRAAHETDVVLESGQKVQAGAESRVVVERPNHVRSDRRGEAVDATLYYDGETISLIGHRNKFYATAKAPDDIDGAIDFLRERLGMEVPAGDLLYSDLYQSFMDNAVSADYLGKVSVRGKACHHLAFRGEDTDWQLWVEDSARALPCKYVITSKDMKQAPQFTVELYDWKVEKDVPDEVFTFEPPEGAQRIQFLGLDGESRTQQTQQRRQGR